MAACNRSNKKSMAGISLFRKILVANRGEVAVRIMRACREMRIRSAAVYSSVDRNAAHVRYADEALPIGPAPSVESYLNIQRILDAARRCQADAIHPGYGFLSEKPEFARACEDAGIVFIGPSAPAMELMGSKTAARQAAINAGLPVVPGTAASIDQLDELRRVAASIGYPLMLKAAAGGGGKGMRRVDSESELESAFRNARSEAANAFNDASVYLEKLIERPRHIEFQVLGDLEGNLIHLGERECSLQRRHQKVIEEAPSPFLDEELRQQMGQTAVRIARLANYSSAGTVEFLVDSNRRFYFLEMNTRLQVEHPVTECVTGLDLVKQQIHVATGLPLSLRQQDIHLRGAALECRVYAEDPENNFFPSPGVIRGLHTPGGPGIRDDSGVYEGWRVPLEYDPLLSKLVAWGANRDEAVERMRRAVREYTVVGIKTNLGFFRRILDHPDFIAANFDTGFIDRLVAARQPAVAHPEASQGERLAAMIAAFLHQRGQQDRTASALPAQPASVWKSAGRERQLDHWPR